MGEGKDGCLRTEGRDGNLNEIINYKLYGIFDILMDYKHIFHESNFSKRGEAGRGQLAGRNSEAELKLCLGAEILSSEDLQSQWEQAGLTIFPLGICLAQFFLSFNY